MALVSKEKLYWRARRGMLELDIMLQSFLDKTYDGLPDSDKEAFVEILNFSDQDLLELLLAREQADCAVISDVIQKIRHTTLTDA